MGTLTAVSQDPELAMLTSQPGGLFAAMKDALAPESEDVPVRPVRCVLLNLRAWHAGAGGWAQLHTIEHACRGAGNSRCCAAEPIGQPQLMC